MIAPPPASSPPIGRRERNRAEKRARILAAAQRLLATQGYQRMTMAQVADDADVAIGTVFQYAATKPELLMMVTADRWSGAFTKVLRAVGDAPPEVLMRRLLEPLVAASRAEPDVTAAIARELLFGADGPHRDEVLALVDELETAIAAVLREAGAGERAPAAARMVVSGGLVEINRTRQGRADDASIDVRLSELIEIALDGTLSPRSEVPRDCRAKPHESSAGPARIPGALLARELTRLPAAPGRTCESLRDVEELLG